MRVTRSSVGRWSGGASWRRRSPAAHWSAAVSNGTARRLAIARRQALDDVGALAGLHHAQPARLALERRRAAEVVAARPQALVLRPQGGHLLALVASLRPRRDPGPSGPDVEVDDEGEDEQQRPAAQAIPADAGVGGGHGLRLRSTPSASSLCKEARLGAEHAAPRILRVGPERLLDAQKLVVLRDAVRARRRARLDLAAARGHREV